MKILEITSDRFDLYSLKGGDVVTRHVLIYPRESLKDFDKESLLDMGMNDDVADQVIDIKDDMMSTCPDSNGVCLSIGDRANIILLGSTDPRVLYHELGHTFHQVPDDEDKEYTRRSECFADVFSAVAILTTTRCEENIESIIDYRNNFKYSTGYWTSNALHLVLKEYEQNGHLWEENIQCWYNVTCDIMSKYLNPGIKDKCNKNYILSKFRLYKQLLKV